MTPERVAEAVQKLKNEPGGLKWVRRIALEALGAVRSLYRADAFTPLDRSVALVPPGWKLVDGYLYTLDDGPGDLLWGSFECARCPTGRTCFEAVVSETEIELMQKGVLEVLRCPRGHEITWSDLRVTVPCSRHGYAARVPHRWSASRGI